MLNKNVTAGGVDPLKEIKHVVEEGNPLYEYPYARL